MLEFIQDLTRSPLLQFALLAGILASVACGVIGSYVVVRRITYVAGGIAHCVLGGMGAAYYLHNNWGWEFLHPLHGAFVAAILAAVLIGLARLRGGQREDTIVGALWAVGMAVGVLFIFSTEGYEADLMSYLFGNIIMVAKEDLWLLIGLDIAVVAVGLLFYNQLQAVCFDEEFARLRGIHVELFYILLLCLTAVTVVTLVSVVGIVMVIALLTLPVAVAGQFCKTLWQMMLASAVLSMVFTSSGLAISYTPEWPAGAVTILLAGVVYVLVLLGSAIARIRRAPAERSIAPPTHS